MRSIPTNFAAAIALMLAMLSGSLPAATAEYGNITVDTRAILQGNVEVRVVNGTTGALVSGAAVTAAGQSQNTINGVATFTNLPSATYTFGVVMAGYASVDQLVTVPAGATRVLAIPIFPGTSLDQPQIPNAASQVIRDVATGGSQRLMLLTSYKLYGTAPDYSVVLHYRRGNTGNWQAIPPANLIDYGTNAPNWGAAVKPGLHQALWDVAVDLPNTQEPMLQVRIIATRNGRSAVKETQFLSLDTRAVVTSTLSGRIVKAGGTPVSGAMVQLMPHQKSVVTGADGTFSLAELTPATGCNLRVSATGYQPFLKNPLAVPSTALNLGDLTLAPEVRVMRLRPLQPNPNPVSLKVPVGGTGYLYFQVMTEDGKLPCPGQTVQLETTGGILIAQSATPHENWAGPTAGHSDKDGIVRLEVPASAVGGVAGAIVNVRVRPSATLAPDTANFPGASAFGATVEVVPREWEQVRDMRIAKELSAGVYLATEDVAEQRRYYSDGQFTGESVSSQTVLSGGIGLDANTGPVFPGLEVGGSVGVHAGVGLSGRDTYYFPAGSSAPDYDDAFKCCLALRGQLPLTSPGQILQLTMNEFVRPNFVPFYGGWEGGLVGEVGTNASLELNLGAAFKSFFVQLGGERSMEAGFRAERFISSPTSSGRDQDSDIFEWEGTTAKVNTQTGAGLNFMTSFQNMKLPDGSTEVRNNTFHGGLSNGTEVNKTIGMRYYPGYGGKAKKVELVHDRGYTDPGQNLDFRDDLTLGSFPSVESVTEKGETRQYETVWKVERRDGGEFSIFDSNRVASVANYLEWYEKTRELSSESNYLVNYERRVGVGKASINADASLSLWLAKIRFGCNSNREAESIVERGRLWRQKELPLWTQTPATKSTIPTTSMLSVITNWGIAGTSEFVDLMGDKIVKATIQGVGYEVSVIKKKVSQIFSANGPIPKGGPQFAPAPPIAEGWENYGISGLYELTSETPIITPVPLVISYTAADLDGGNAADLGAYYFVPETSNWEKLPATLDTVAMTVTVSVTRTGYYGLALPQPAGAIPLMLDAVPPLAADGVTTANLRAAGLVFNNGNPVPDGTLYTVTAQGVSLTGTDASATLDGLQLASSVGTLVIGVKTPTGGADAVVSVESAGIGTAKGALEFALRDTTAPPAPSGTGITTGTSWLRASWAKPDAPDIAGYRVYYKQGAAGPPWDGVSAVEGNASPVFTDELFADIKGLVPGATYHLAVAAVDTTGNESPLGTVESATLQAGPPAPTPSAAAVKGADGRVFLSWALSPDDLLGQRNVDHYEVCRRLPGGAWTVIGTAASGQSSYGDAWPAGLAANEYPEYSIVPVSASGTTGQATGPLFDSDSDTLPDPWESANGLNPHDFGDAAANGDGDLRNNLEEFLAGSFPGISDGADFRVTQFATETSTNGSRLADSGTVSLSWNAKATLAAGESYIVEASQTLAAGTWQRVTDAQITVVNRTGVAVVARHADRPREFYRIAIAGEVAISSYVSWIGGFPSISSGDSAATADPDRDGIPNAVEMVLGGNPATVMNADLLPEVTTATDPGGAVPAGDYIVFTYRRTDTSVAGGLVSAVEFDTDMVGPWTQAVNGTGGVRIVETTDRFGSGVDRVQVYIPRSGSQKVFARLRVLVP